MKGDTDEDDPIEDVSRQGETLFEDQPLQSRSSPTSESPSQSHKPPGKGDLRHLLNAATETSFDDDMQRALRLSMSDK
jgi:hypothetical protein